MQEDFNVQKHPDAFQLCSARDGRGDTRVCVAIRAQTERIQCAIQGE
jgi:hypothetical protein